MINTERLCLGCMNDNGGEKICSLCGYDKTSKNPENSLPKKFLINNRYLIGKVIKSNGEGITYIGWDNSSDSIVEIREYFPIGFAHRNPDKTVSIDSEGKYTFNEGLMEFIEINTNIMNSDLPSLTEITDVFEENGTVYAVSKAITGITLKEFLKRNGDTLKWEQARALFLPLIDTVKGMNDLGIIHGGISTDTILVGRDGKLRITDYSIKKLRSDKSELESQIFDGFAAIEQYDVTESVCDTYTDVYGLCATLFNVLIGVVAPSALTRLKNDSLTIPAKFAEELPRQVLASLANGLQILPQDRTPNIEVFKNQLVYGEISEPKVNKKELENKPEAKVKSKNDKKNTAKYLMISALCTALIFLILGTVLAFTVFKDDLFPKDSEITSEKTSSIEAPDIDKIGDVDSDAAVSAKLYAVSDFRGKYYSQIIEDEENEPFEFTIKDKEYSNDYPKGTVISQSVASGSNVARDTKIELVISLGAKEVKIANLKGLTEDKAKIELLKQGFLYENIEILEKFDEDGESGVVLEQDPKYGETVSPDEKVQIYINSYTE